MRIPAHLPLACLLLAAAPADAVRYRIDTFAGSGDPAARTADAAIIGDGLPATEAIFDRPTGLARDAGGNIYVTDHNHARVRRIQMHGRARIVTTVAGSGTPFWGGDGGPATAAGLVLPTGLAFLPGGDLLIADAGNEHAGNTVRRIDNRGIIHAFAGLGGVPAGDFGDGGDARNAIMFAPVRLAVTNAGDVLIAELGNNKVRLVRAATGRMEPFAGTGLAGDAGDEGPAVQAELDSPAGVAIGRDGVVYISDFGNHRIRTVTPDGVIHAFAGTGFRTGFIDGPGNDPRDDLGDGGPAGAASFWKPTGIAFDRQGGLLVADQGNSRIRRIAPDRHHRIGPSSTIRTIVGNGTPGFSGDGGDALDASLTIPTEVLPLGRRLLIADRGNQRVRIAVPVTSLCSASCNDGDPCTVDRCRPNVGCTHQRVARAGCP